MEGKSVDSGESVGVLKYNILNCKIRSSRRSRLVNCVLLGHDNVKFDRVVQAFGVVLLSPLSG